jgi:hypothetical protein
MGRHQARIHSDQTVLMMTRARPKTLKGELENNSRKLMDLVRKQA